LKSPSPKKEEKEEIQNFSRFEFWVELASWDGQGKQLGELLIRDGDKDGHVEIFQRWKDISQREISSSVVN
jgi:hypothetical protein